MARKTPSVVLVGRPNVGKSTLFNRITGSRRAIVAPIAGTTRDSLARPAVWRAVSFPLSATRARPGRAARGRRRVLCEGGGWTRRPRLRRRDDRARAARGEPPGDPRHQQ